MHWCGASIPFDKCLATPVRIEHQHLAEALAGAHDDLARLHAAVPLQPLDLRRREHGEHLFPAFFMDVRHSYT